MVPVFSRDPGSLGWIGSCPHVSCHEDGPVCNDTTTKLYMFKMILDLMLSIWPVRPRASSTEFSRHGTYIGSWETPTRSDFANDICFYETISKHKAGSSLFFPLVG